MADIAELQLEKRSGKILSNAQKLKIQPLFTSFSIVHPAFQPGFHPVPKGRAGPTARQPGPGRRGESVRRARPRNRPAWIQRQTARGQGAPRGMSQLHPLSASLGKMDVTYVVCTV